jgi:hypothetical protein
MKRLGVVLVGLGPGSQPHLKSLVFEDVGFHTVRTEDLGYLLAPGVQDIATWALAPARALRAERGARLSAAIDRVLGRVAPSLGTTFLLDARADHALRSITNAH